jgi:hypothetical protein
MRQHALVILDFSGTLSLGSSLFGREESLTQALRDCGLWGAGVNHPDHFWQKVADATWEEGSVTGEALPRVEVAARVRRFVNGYLSHATVDAAWVPLVTRAGCCPGHTGRRRDRPLRRGRRPRRRVIRGRRRGGGASRPAASGSG